MKYNILRIAFLVIIFNITPQLYSQATFESSRYNYSLTIPENWIQIPDSVLERYLRVISGVYDIEYIEHDAGFQLESDRYMTYPMIFVRVKDAGELDFEDFVYLFEKNNEKYFKKAVDKFKGDMSMDIDGEFVVDNENSIMYFAAKGNYFKTDIRFLTMVKFINGYIITINAFDEVDKFDSSINTFIDIIYSVK